MANPNDLYPSTGGDPREISLRSEMQSTLDGSSVEVPKKRQFLIRRMRLDAGKKVPCECRSSLTKEGDKDILCGICMGEGYKWDEVLLSAYKSLTIPKEVAMAPGLINAPSVLFYTYHNAVVSKDDKIVELFLDLEGTPIQPMKRKAIYDIWFVEDYRLDNGRVEYLKLWTFKEDVKFL